MAGRPTKFTPELAKKICRWVAAGVSVEAAAEAEGVARATVYNWRERGQEGKEPYASFVTDLAKAHAQVEARLSVTIVNRAKDDWRAGAWHLERRVPERFAEQAKLEKKLEEIVGKVLDAAREEMDPDGHQRLLRKLAREGREE